MSIVMHGMNRKGEKRCGFWRAAAAMCLLCGIGTSCAAAPVLTEGPLLKFRESGKTAFLGLVDPQEHVRAVAAVGDQAPGLPNARQEFCGHYLDLCATYWHIDREPRAKAFGDLVVAAAGESMSEDGYIGGETPERRKLGFSLWNQAHVVYGLLGFAKATGSGAALRLGVKAADWLFRTQSAMTPAELVNPKTSWNDGSQHLTAFYSFALAADATGDERYLDYVGNTLKGLESTKMNFLSSDGCLDMQSRKGIEMLNAWRGVLAYAQRRDDPEARTAALRNWRSIADTQIREPGSSTCAERFYEGGGRPELLPITRKPNENCVQCGWLRFSREMFGATGEPQCMDEMERTLYNHILGSVSNAGYDFA